LTVRHRCSRGHQGLPWERRLTREAPLSASAVPCLAWNLRSRPCSP